MCIKKSKKFCKPIIGLFLGGLIILFSAELAAGQSFDAARDVIRDLDSIVTPNGIQESYQTELGGQKQWIFVRGKNRNNPIILFVHGGPASPMAPLAWTFQRPLEEFFTIIHYDQRGSGKTYASADTAGLGETIHIDQFVEDAVGLASFISRKYNQQKLILMGHSWGTIVALKAVLEKPDLFSAYVGIGQVIYTFDNERLSYAYGLQQARKHRNNKAIAELESIAPYPGDKPITRERIIIARTWPQYYGGLSAYRNESSQFFRAPKLSPLYLSRDIKAINEGSLFTLAKLLPEFLKVDMRGVRNFPIPIFMFMGRHDYTTPTLPVEKWFSNLHAPAKNIIWFENSAHLIPIEESGKFLITLHNQILPHATNLKKVKP